MSKYIIIGSSAAAIAAIQNCLQEPTADIVCITQDRQPYNTCLLSSALATSVPISALEIQIPVYERVKVYYETTVTSIDAALQVVHINTGESMDYDRLLIATGSLPRRLPLELPMHDAGIRYYHTLEDMQAIQSYIQEQDVTRAIIIGAGINGLECAAALHALAIKTTLIERDHRILSVLVTEDVSVQISQLYEQQGSEICCGQELITIEYSKGEYRIITRQGLLKTAPLVILALGSYPNTALAASAGILLQGNAIAVNNYMQTSQPAIFAAGDCVSVLDFSRNQCTKNVLWHDALLQGTVAGYNMMQLTSKSYKGRVPVLSTLLFDKPLIIAGNTGASVRIENQSTLEGSTALYYDEKGLCGYVLYGHRKNAGLLRQELMKRYA